MEVGAVRVSVSLHTVLRFNTELGVSLQRQQMAAVWRFTLPRGFREKEGS